MISEHLAALAAPANILLTYTVSQKFVSNCVQFGTMIAWSF